MTAAAWERTATVIGNSKGTARVAFRNVTHDGDEVIVQVTRTGNSTDMTAVTIVSAQPLTSRHLRFLPVDGLRKAAADKAFGGETRRAIKAVKRSITRATPYSDDHLILVAQLFTQARALGGSGVAAVADACDVPEYTASRYVRRAREQAARLGIQPLGTEDHSTATRRAMKKTAGRKDSNGK